ncbi:PAS domain S-box-containing protein [Halogranum rubrum]|uniref:histidine kinase n=1 Tax=Halogranum rubrum TaxID=553466 RepID=A0A1I4CC57_9EURY|nr:PAS domain-containing protein [Halogranum rubrum]SFK78764.1 PAS domain S-box-containing protein [Halogranum rubrum]
MTDADVDVDERLAAALFRDPGGLMGLLDADGTIRRVNQTAAKSLGFDEESLVGESLAALPGWSASTREQLRDALDAVRDGEFAQLEVENQAFSRSRWFHLSLWPALDDSETVDTLVLRGIDVTRERATRTERRRLKRQRDAERELLERVLETAPVSIYVTNDDHDVVRTNSRLDSLLTELGVDSVAQLGTTDHVTLLDADGTPLDPPTLVSDVVFETGRAVDGVKRGVELDDGSRRWFSVNAVPVFDDGGDVEYVVSCKIDITGQELQHQALTLSKQRITVLNRVLRHDIRTQSNIIAGYADLIASATEASSEASTFARIVADTASELSEMSDTVRKMEEIIGGVEGAEVVALDTLVSDAVASFEREYPNASLDVDVLSPLFVFGVPGLTEVFSQVLKNAVTHNDSEHPRVSLTTRRLETPSLVEVRISDNGPGIPHEEVEVLSRDAEDSLHHGSGLGLWFVNWLVVGVGGSLDFETDDTGTTVVIRLREQTERSQVVSLEDAHTGDIDDTDDAENFEHTSDAGDEPTG